MIIDGHAHVGGEYKDLPTIISTLEKTGVTKVILCPADSSRPRSIPIPDLTRRFPGQELNFVINKFIRSATSKVHSQHNIDKGNTGVFNLSALAGGRVVQFFWANPLKNGIIGEVESKIELWNFKGIKLHQSCHPFKIISTHFHDIASFAALKGIPVFIHLFSKQEVLDFISVAGNYRTYFIAGHLIGLEIFIQQKKKVPDNIFFDISCPPLVSVERIKMAINEFGPGRVVMGSDTPYGKRNIEQAISRIRALNLSSGECEMILGNNLKGILMI